MTNTNTPASARKAGKATTTTTAEALAKYNGEEEAYIKDNYCIHDNFSWDYITQAQYIPDCEETEVYEIDFENIKD